MKTRSATAAARAAPKAKAPLDVPETVSSGDTGGVRSWALLLGWCVCSYVLYAALRTAATVIGGKMLPFMCVHTILGFLVAASAATLLALLLFGRAVGANAEIRATNTDAAVRWHEEEGKSVLVPTIGFAKKRGALPRYTLAQVAAHETRDDLWIVIDEKAYDITHLVASHPGGVGPLVAMAGKVVAINPIDNAPRLRRRCNLCARAEDEAKEERGRTRGRSRGGRRCVRRHQKAATHSLTAHTQTAR